EGAHDMTIGPLVKLWGFAHDEPGLEGKEPDAQAIQQAKALVDYRALELMTDKNGTSAVYSARLKKKGMWIDVGSFSKGYCADRAMEVLKKNGIKNALIAAGGTICAMGCKPDGSLWKVGIRHPRKDDFMTFINLKNASLSTSGDYEKYYKKKNKRRAHIIDPRTGLPVSGMQSVTILAKTGLETDCLDTSLFVLGAERGVKLADSLPGTAALFVADGGKITRSQDWPEGFIAY
ncbi:MAG: FAD:protein FMN transferase, partial [Pseudomonadota bacterium]